MSTESDMAVKAPPVVISSFQTQRILPPENQAHSAGKNSGLPPVPETMVLSEKFQQHDPNKLGKAWPGNEMVLALQDKGKLVTNLTSQTISSQEIGAPAPTAGKGPSTPGRGGGIG